ncbi:MAG TPA: transcription antitermination factor NusB [Candidatus Omnitrophota bacterium]|nr:transcription antitermination factor NusB [Candidatus Omnitrophota bacterium]HPD85078.1 transcription antitermination factor NusB [Candidatus Omnitrophota bacterium]HRZ03936.1 transcription antitermination factor NusB [Candidatus Omnitrophota bacterium]
MRKRTQSREWALKILYQADITGKPVLVSAEEFIANEEKADKEVADFCKRLVVGIGDNLEAIDSKIRAYATNWDFKRIAVIDRNILRLGIFELMHTPDVPPKVTINEAVELAKKYGDLESSKFVNGILDNIHKKEIAPQDKKS